MSIVYSRPLGVEIVSGESPLDGTDTRLNSAASSSDEPAVRVQSLSFSDGTTVSIDPSDVVVLVGPNNAGKSRALHDIEDRASKSSTGVVVKEVTFTYSGTVDELTSYIEKHSTLDESGRDPVYKGYRFAVRSVLLPNLWNGPLRELTPLFCMRIPTERRITDSDPVQAVAFLDEPGSHPIHMLYKNDALERRISEFFYRAFGEHLIVFRLGGRTIPLLVGEYFGPEDGEDRVSESYNVRLLESTTPLKEQGDGMRSFASVVLHLLTPITSSILLLDEPEAYLHPPQARLLGEIIATECQDLTQLFVATHSPDVLQGLLNVVNADHLRVIRIERDGDVNHIKELNKDQAREIGSDPLMKYSSVLSGVFHERVVICEADTDCMFYSSLLDIPEVHGGPQPDVLFVHASGKHRMAVQARALAALGVHVDVIADMDVLQEEAGLQRIFEALGGDWSRVQAKVRSVRTAIETHKPWLNAEEVSNGIRTVLEGVGQAGEFPRSAQQDITAFFRKVSPWDVVKDTGEAAIPSGQATTEYGELREAFQHKGLWIVPVGELEGFCKNVGGHGPRWVQEVIGKYDLVNSDELRIAREFVGKVWQARRAS